MLRTTEDVTMGFRMYGDITIPKGTTVTNGNTMGYHSVQDLSWIAAIDEIPQYGLIIDAEHFGITIPERLVEEVE